jgi:hypothetical protein
LGSAIGVDVTVCVTIAPLRVTTRVLTTAEGVVAAGAGLAIAATVVERVKEVDVGVGVDDDVDVGTGAADEEVDVCPVSQ